MSQLAQTGLFDATVPRYTSYPTAPHFTAAIDGEDTARWLSSLGSEATISLYVHIPFCERLCWFCACRTQGVRSPEPVARYLETLKSEITHVAASLTNRPKVVALHWGGGTPTILTPVQITDLIGHLRCAFDWDDDVAFSVEIDPTLVDEHKVDALKAGGITRASIGIQDFDRRIQAAIGRDQSFEQTRAVVQMLRSAGISSLNTDIVYGLPHQTVSGIATSIDQVLALEPDRVALFGYAHVPWMAKRQRMIDPNSLPGPQARLELAETAEQIFTKAGFRPVGIDHFALPEDSLAIAAEAGHLRRNFQGYTDDRATALIGLGASAISQLPQGYTQNAPATAAYAGRIRSGNLATSRGYALRLEDRVRADFIERFLCDLRAGHAAIKRKFGNFADILLPDIQHALTKFSPWLEMAEGQLTLTAEGKPLARLVAAEFDSFLGHGTASHSQAI